MRLVDLLQFLAEPLILGVIQQVLYEGIDFLLRLLSRLSMLSRFSLLSRLSLLSSCGTRIRARILQTTQAQ